MWRLIMAYRTVTEAHAVSGLIRPLLPSGHVRPCVCVCCNECDPPAFARTWVRTNLNYTPNIDYVRMFVWCLMYVRAVSTRSKLQHTHLTAIAHAFMVANRGCRHRRLRVWSVCNDDDDGNVALTCTRMQRTQSSACFFFFFFVSSAHLCAGPKPWPTCDRIKDYGIMNVMQTPGPNALFC